MGTKSLKITKLLLDLKNPRISQADSQRDALQKIIDDQKVKLVALADSIVKNGLNPMDRFLVIKSEEDPEKFTVIEGNRRLAAIKILHNPAVLTGLNIQTSIQRRFEVLAAGFDAKSLEPLDCFEVAAREDGAIWIHQRHTGENQGRGIVDWIGVASARFRGNDPALQALDFVRNWGNLSEAEKAEVEDDFPITTLDRLLSTPGFREIIGVELSNGKLFTGLPFPDIIKPLRRIIKDLASGQINVTKVKLQPQMIEYANSLGKDLPDLSNMAETVIPLDELIPSSPDIGDRVEGSPSDGSEQSSAGGATGASGKAASHGARKRRVPPRRALIPGNCNMNVNIPKIAEIFKELRSLALANYPHAISVLLRVFLELSVDEYLKRNNISAKFTSATGHTSEKKLHAKIEDCITHMIGSGVPSKELDGIRKGISDKNSPVHVNTLHNYVHNAFYTPIERELVVAWDNTQPFFERLWP